MLRRRWRSVRGASEEHLDGGEREALQERLRGVAVVKETSRKRLRGVGGASEERKKTVLRWTVFLNGRHICSIIELCKIEPAIVLNKSANVRLHADCPDF